MTSVNDVDPDRRYQTVNPATGQLVKEFPGLPDEGAEAALARSHAAYRAWRRVAISERAGLLRAYANVLNQNVDELAGLVTLEMGKPLAQAQWEARTAASMFDYYAEHGEALLAEETLEVPGFAKAVTRREPVGVVLAIEPWNGPLYQAARAAAPNLMLGNTVLVKPSEVSAGSTLFLDHLFAEAGFPADVYQTALVSTRQVATWIEDDRVRAVTLTGSNRAGAAVGEQAGRNIKPVVLELGGSDAFIVLDSANVARAAETAASCRLVIGGQVCCSPKRVIVTDQVADEFIDTYVSTFANQKVGDPFDSDTTVGPMSTDAAADLLQDQLQDALDKGATTLLAGGRRPGPGAYFQPAVITDITPDMRVFTEEAFGPLGMIYRVPDADAAVALANSSQYGLGGTVFAQDMSEAYRVADELDTGAVGINNYLGAPIEIPFGGTKRSGVGRELGRSGMDQFANLKTYGIA